MPGCLFAKLIMSFLDILKIVAFLVALIEVVNRVFSIIALISPTYAPESNSS